MKRSRVIIVGVAAMVLLAATAAVAVPTRFKDVPADHTFSVAIDWMDENGITKGCNPPDNDMFCPEDYVTRGQMSAFMKRLVESDLMPAGTQGAKGDKGATGATGAQGPKGATGAVGPAGPAGGGTGPAGPQGDQGDQGPEGPKGDTGATGAEGLKGDTGATGAAGAIGPEGPKGDTGATGAAGATGAEGPKGDTGATGAAGAIGPEGPKGDTGATGAAGPAGAVGPVGPVGPAGAVGPVGPAGAVGPVGPAGPRATFTRVEGTISANDSTSPKTVTVTCPTGAVVVGGGHSLGGSDSVDLHVVSSYPTNATTWSVTGAEADAAPIGSNWTVRAYAICAS